MYGISACVTILSGNENSVTVQERVNRVYYSNQLIMGLISLSGILFTSIHLILCGSHWCPIILLIFCIITFVMNVIYLIKSTPDKCRDHGCCSYSI